MQGTYISTLWRQILKLNNVTTWRPCEASYHAFLAEISKTVQSYTGYRGNSQFLVDEETA